MAGVFREPPDCTLADIGGLWKIERENIMGNIYHLILWAGLNQQAFYGAYHIIL